jgi:hypothetical protein
VNNKGVVAAIVIIIVVVVGGVYLAAQSAGPNNNTINMSNITPQNVSQNNTTESNNGTNSTNATNSTNNTNYNNTQTTISAQQAQKIAQAYILESGAKAGNPTLTKWPDGRLVWHVPIINSNGKYEGIGIDIDAQTGANLGES